MSMSNEQREVIVKKHLDPSIPYRLTCGESMTKQSFKDECDINNILKKYEKNGVIEHRNKYQGRYDDVTGAVDYQTALGVIASAETAFMSLPAAIRTQFDNDPHKFLEFAQDSENSDLMVEMGLLTAVMAEALPSSKAEASEDAETDESPPASS